MPPPATNAQTGPSISLSAHLHPCEPSRAALPPSTLTYSTPFVCAEAPSPTTNHQCRTPEQPQAPSTKQHPARSLDSPTHATRQRWARGSERIPRLSAAILGVACSYTLTYTRTAALVCACASSSYGAAPAEHVRCTLERDIGWTGAMVNCREACASGAICLRASLCMEATFVLCCLCI